MQTVCKTSLIYLFLSTLKKGSHTPIPTTGKINDIQMGAHPLQPGTYYLFVSQDMKMLEEANTAGLFVVCFAFRRLNTTQRGAN